jgi:hypothetical protein
VAYRVEHNGFVIHADTVDDVRALVVAIEKPLLPLMQERRKVERQPVKRQRGSSDGALEGRIVSVLQERGALSPADLCEAVKAERHHVNVAAKALEAAGKIRSEGQTTKRRLMLAKAETSVVRYGPAADVRPPFQSTNRLLWPRLVPCLLSISLCAVNL